MVAFAHRRTWSLAMVALISVTWRMSLVSGWTTGSAVSGFSGSVLLLDRRVEYGTVSSSSGACGWLSMKKGKANVPPQMRGQYEKQKEMMAQREQMIAMTKPGPDGFPVFNLFVRTKRANVRFSFVGRSLAECSVRTSVWVPEFCLSSWIHFAASLIALSRCGTPVAVSRATIVPSPWPRITPMEDSWRGSARNKLIRELPVHCFETRTNWPNPFVEPIRNCAKVAMNLNLATNWPLKV
jgi:hypothetical protein